MTDPADYLLEKHGIINLPDEIDHAAYELILHRVLQGRELHGDKPLMLYCRCDGGSAWDAEAIVALIEADSNIDGILIGETMSAGAFIWASCARRYVYPEARLGIHPTRRDVGYVTKDVLVGFAQEGDTVDRFQCLRYEKASRRDFGWWWQKLHAPGDVKWLDTKELVEIGMAKLYSEHTSWRFANLNGVKLENGAKASETA